MKFLRTLSILLFLVAGTVLRADQPDGFLSAPDPAPDRILSNLLGSETRTIVSLDGSWEFSLDGEEWAPVVLPAGYLGADRFWLRRTFRIPPGVAQTKSWILHGFGVQYSGSIKINDAFIVQREGLIPFSSPLPEDVELKETNTIVVEVDNRLDFRRTLPGRRMPLDVRTYGGIVRSLLLVGTPLVRIDDIGIVRSNGSTPTFDVRIVANDLKGMRLGGAAGDTGGVTRLSSEAIDVDVSVALTGGRTTDTTTTSVAGSALKSVRIESRRTATTTLAPEGGRAALWSTGDPGLSRAVIEVRYQGRLIDRREIRFGSRRLSASGNRLLLNDSAILVKGVVYIEDSRTTGVSLSYDRMREDVEAIRDLGANAIRFSGGVPHPYMLSLCDELGLLAFVDIPIGSFPASFFREEEIIERAVDRVEATIEATRGYTSVVAYGVGFPGSLDPEASTAMLEQIRSIVEEEAGDRLFYAVADDWEGGESLVDLVDIAGIGRLDGSIEGLGRLVSRVAAAVGERRPVVCFAFGRLVQIGNESGYADITSTQSQAKFIGDAIALFEKAEIAGFMYWAYSDYRTDRPLLTIDNDDQFVSTSGLTTLDGESRIAAKTLAAHYTDQKEPDLAIGEYSPPSTILFIGVGIVCAILFLFLINGSRRFRENVFRAFLRPYNFYSDIRDQRILSTFQTTVLALVIAATIAVIFASLFYFYRMEESFDFVLSAVVSADGLKETLNYLIWRPVLAVIVFTSIAFVALLAVAALVRLCSIFVRNRIFFGDAYAISIWGALPVLLLIPVAMVLYRLLELPGAGPVAITIVMLVALWIIYRILRGTSVIFDVPAPRVYMYGVGTVVALLLILFFTSGSVAAMVGYLFEGVGSLYRTG